MLKVKLACNWIDSNSLVERVTRNCVLEEDYEPNIKLIGDGPYDILISINSLLESPRVPKQQIYTFIMEPSWSCNWNRNCFSYSNTVFVHDKQLFGNHLNIVETPSLMFYHMDWQQHSINELLTNINFAKPKKASMVVSYSPNEGPPNTNYKKRTELALSLLKYNFDVDIFGNCWDQYGSHKNLKGYISNKYYGLVDYEYSIGVENSNEHNYVSEKFFDIALCNSMPIYCGATNINDIYLNSLTFDVNDIDCSLDFISDLIKIKPNEEQILSIKHTYYKKYNFYKKVIEIAKTHL